ncbi:hypothetical protein [Flagellimonas sp.]|uniref:hypothetical protein n=1 Tax=Flagellimonas sp. TaxID=2058762 RepID=UPI003AB7E11F
MEQLLTKEDIKEILYGNFKNPVLRYYGTRLIPKEHHPHTTLVAVSDRHSLLLIKGNKDTGNQHIIDRHNYWSTKLYTVQKENGETVFQHQSRFPGDVSPFHFLAIADEIYKPENLIKDNPHRDSDKFDLYVGEYLFEKKNKEKVKLLVYKNTKIIHSLFLQSAKYNKKRVNKFPFSRGEVKYAKKKPDEVRKVLIPYFDSKFKLCFGITIEKYPEHNREDIIIMIFDPESSDLSKYNFIKIQEREIKNFVSEQAEEFNYQHADLREVEKLIQKLDNDLKSGRYEFKR